MKFQKDILNILLIVFVLLRIVNHFYYNIVLSVISAAILITVITFTIPKLGRTVKLIMAFMLLLGVALLIYADADWQEWLYALLLNGSIVMLFICSPMLGMPYYYQDYQGELKTLAQIRMRNVLSFLVLLTFFSHMLSVILSVGAVLIVYNLMQPFAKLYNAEKPFLKSVTRSLFSAGFWSPAWATVIIYSVYPDIRWIRVVPIAIVFSVIFNVMNLAVIYVETKRKPNKYIIATPLPEVLPDMRKLAVMLALTIVIVVSVVIFYVTSGWDLLLVVSVIAIVFPVAAAIIQKFIKTYKIKMREFYDVSLIKVREQVALFTLAGFLAGALDKSGVGLLMINLLPDWLRQSPFLMIVAIILIFVIPSFIGVHPTATGTALVIVLSPDVLGLTYYTYCLAILSGWTIGMMLAPFSAAAIMLSSANGKSTFANSWLINWKFGIACIVVFSFLSSVIGPLLG